MEVIIKYFPDLSTLQVENFAKLKLIYESWNQKINLLSRKSFDKFYLEHVLHSLAIAKFINFLPETQIMDLGTGGGFPGIPLALYFPNCEFLLVDSIEKKTKALQEIAKELELTNVKVLCKRAESINQKFDFILTRAVAPLEKLYTWSKDKIKKEKKHSINNGLICLKGGNLDEELKNYPKALEFQIKKYFEEAFFESKKIVFLEI